MNKLDAILELDKSFLDKYNNRVIDEQNLDIFIDELERFESIRNKLISELDFNILKLDLSNEDIMNYISKISYNQENITNVVNIGKSICRKNLSNINKSKKINSYSIDAIYTPNFIDIVK